MINIKNCGIPWYIFLRLEMVPVICYQQEYRQTIWSLSDVIIKVEYLTLDHIDRKRLYPGFPSGGVTLFISS